MILLVGFTVARISFLQLRLTTVMIIAIVVTPLLYPKKFLRVPDYDYTIKEPKTLL